MCHFTTALREVDMHQELFGKEKHAGSISGGQQNLCKLSLTALEHTQRPGLAALEAVQTESYVGHNKGNFYSDEHL